MKKLLIYGFGNPGREDDGLGIACVEKLSRWAHKNNYNFIDFDSNYQLNIEDAAQIVNYDTVIFIDASVDDRVNDYLFEPIKLEPNYFHFTTHSASPAYIVYLCKKLFNFYPDSYLLHIKGYSFDFIESITSKALENLNKAYEYLTLWIANNFISSKVFTKK